MKTKQPLRRRDCRCSRWMIGNARHIVCVLGWIFFACVLAEAGSYQPAYSTYFGGAKRWDQARDVCVDAEGNVYITGGTTSVDFPTTPGAFDRSYNQGGKDIGSGGNCDAFVSKFDPSGKLVWSTFLGGPNYDRGYGIKVDAAGFVCVCGRAGPGFPVTEGAFQPAFHGINAGIYGLNNGFVAKLKPDGSGLVWASYVGAGSLCRDLDIDKEGNVFTHLGIGVDSAGRVFVTGQTNSDNFPCTPDAFQSTPGGDNDAVLVLLAPDLSRLEYATRMGGPKWDFGRAGCIGANGDLYITGSCSGEGWPTRNPWQAHFAGGVGNCFEGGCGAGDVVLARFTLGKTD